MAQVYFLTNGALFILLPFAYFYYETEDLQHRRWFSKTFETLKVLVLVDALMYGFTKLVQFLLSLNSAHGFAALNAMACGMGALVILQTLPSGFVALFEFARCVPPYFAFASPKTALVQEPQRRHHRDAGRRGEQIKIRAPNRGEAARVPEESHQAASHRHK